MKNPVSKDLKLITYNETREWAKSWIYDMINYGKSNNYRKFIYDNIYDMKEFITQNKSKEYFYIGYLPKGSIYGPYYIGAFELDPKRRDFNTYLIMQNPNYLNIDIIKEKKRFINFKKELLSLSYKSNVFFKYNKLKYITSCERYYLAWLYEDDD